MGFVFGAIWEHPEGGFIKFVLKRASKQDQTLHMEGKLHVILYCRAVCILKFKKVCQMISKNFLPSFIKLLVFFKQGNLLVILIHLTFNISTASKTIVYIATLKMQLEMHFTKIPRKFIYKRIGTNFEK